MASTVNKSTISEFDLIARFFTRPNRSHPQLTLGIGDDCALLRPTPGMEMAISSDMLVEGRHFLAGADPQKLGHKCLAVNLSDLAAMGARPLGFTLAFSLPQADASWLAGFADGLFALADAHDCALIGGDTTRGPLNICITIFGETPPGQALRRDAAQARDDIWISGTLGEARLALAGLRQEVALDRASLAAATARLDMPTPRVTLGLALRGIAHAAIDISDGLSGDLGHILQRSNCGAHINLDVLPLGPVLTRQPQALQREFALAGGDDYELCFTAATAQRASVLAAGHAAGTAVTRIGSITPEAGLRLVDANGARLDLQYSSFDHFTSP